MRRSKTLKKVMSLFMVMTMILSMVPTMAFAAETDVQSGELYYELEPDTTPALMNLDEANSVVAKNTTTGKTYADLATAVGEAEEGEVIVLYDDVDSMPTINKPLTIKGAEDKNVQVNCFIAENFPNIVGTVTFKNLTFNDRISTEYNSSDQSNLTLEFVDCVFNVKNQYAIQGGSTAKNPGNDVLGALVVEDCTFNVTSEAYNNNYMVYAQCVNTLTITNSEFYGNNVCKGAIHTGDSIEQATTATIKDNIIEDFARGIQIGNRVTGSKLTIDNNIFEGVVATSNESKSGAIYVHGNANAGTTRIAIIDNAFNNSDEVVYNDGHTNVAAFVTEFTDNTRDGVPITMDKNGDVAGETAPSSSGTITQAYTVQDSDRSRIYGEITGMSASESVVIKLYSSDTLLSTTTLTDKNYLSNSSLTYNIVVGGRTSSSWNTDWEEGHPNPDVVPDKVVLYIDGTEMNSAVVTMDSQPDKLGVVTDWATLQGVNSAPAGVTTIDLSQGSYTITDDGEYVVLAYEGANTLTIKADANVTLKGVDITAGADTSAISIESGDVTLNVADGSTLTGGDNGAGIYVAEGASVTIEGEGELTAIGNAGADDASGAAGIGGTWANGNSGAITIDGATVIAKGYGVHGSGIGSGSGKVVGEIVITNGADVTAQGGYYSEGGKLPEGDKYGSSLPEGGAAIGGGGKTASTIAAITIADSKVIAYGGSKAAGIGANFWSSVTLIDIDDSTVTAFGGVSSAGIGTSRAGTAGVSAYIEITDSTVNATGGYHGAGIGGGYNGDSVANLPTTTIVIGGSSNVTATGANGGAGIGGGYKTNNMVITIGNTAQVTAIASQLNDGSNKPIDQTGASAIGSGANGSGTFNGSVVEIADTATVTVTAHHGGKSAIEGMTNEAADALANVTVHLEGKPEPTGTNSPGYTKEVDGYVRVWGEGGGNASESFELKLYSGEKLIATTKLNNVGGIIDGDVYVTWNFFYPESTDEYWTTTWENGQPNPDDQPNKVVLYVDGTDVVTTDVQMNGADNLNPVVWAELGGVKPAATAVAQVGSTTYSNIDEAIENWTAGTTLTLLANVPLSDVITIKSTEHHILNLGTYTMTAAAGKNAIEIVASGTGDSERTALTINADATNPGGINAGSESVVYYDYSKGTTTGNDRPIIKINGGVFSGSTSSLLSAGIYAKGTAARKCATFNISGGTFNCSILGTGKSKMLISGGIFNYSVGSQGDSTCYRLISGGTFKSFGFMTADAANKFGIGTALSNYNVGVYVDDNGYLVVGGPVITEAGDTFKASSANYSGWNSYLKYSSAAANELYYTNVEEALADNNKATDNVTLYVDELDLTGSTFKGTITLPEANGTLVVTFAEGTTPAWTVATNVEGAQVSYTDSVSDGIVTRTYRVTKPTGTITPGYVATPDGISDGVWGEASANASESLAIELYASETKIASASLNNVGGIIDGDVYVTWSIPFAGSTDEYWSVEWAEGHPSVDSQPTKVVLCVDGEQVAENEVKMNSADDLYPTTWEEVLNANKPWDGVTITNLEELKMFRDAVNAGDNYENKTVTLTDDIDLGSEEWAPIGTGQNPFNGTFDGGNYTISNLVINMEGKSDVGLFGRTNSGEIKNLTVENAKVTGRLNVGVVAGTPYTSKFTNITVTGHVEVNGMSYVGGVGGKNAYADWTDITVNVDETSYVNANSVENGTAYRTYVGGVIGFVGEGGHTFENITSNIDVTGSTCDVGGITGIAHYGNNFINVTCSGDVTVNASDPDDVVEAGGIAGTWHNGGAPVTFQGLTYTGTLSAPNANEVEFPNGGLIGAAYSAAGTGVIDGDVAIVDGKTYATLAEAITAAQPGDTVYVIAADTYKLPGFTKELTIKADVDGVIIDNGGAVALSGAKVTFENLTFDYYPNVDYTGLQHVNTVTYNNCTINGQVFLYGTSETFNNCTFNQNSADAYNVWTYGAKNVEFNDCTFNSAGKSVLVYNEGACATDLTVNNTKFIASAPVEGKAAIEIDTTLMPDGTDIVINNSTDTGFAAGSISGKTLWNDKKNQTDLTVTVDGVKVWPIVKEPAADMTYSAYGFGTSGEGEKYRENFQIDLYNVYAEKSLVVELYSGETPVATTTMRETDRDDETVLIARPIEGSKTVNVVVAGRLAGSWDTEWHIDPSVEYIPDTAKIYADGVLVDTYTPAFDESDAAAYAALPGVAKTAVEKFDISYASMTMGNSLAISFAFEKGHVGDWTGHYAEIVKTYADGRDNVVQIVEVTDWLTANIGGVEHYYVTFNGIAAKEMSDEVYVTIYNTEGEAVSNTYEDSVRAQSMRNLARPAIVAEEATMVVDMLNYGAEAQLNFDYAEDDLANNQLTDEQKNMATKSTEYENTRTSSGSYYVASNLEFTSNIKMLMAFRNVSESMHAVVTYTDHYGREKEILISKTDFIEQDGFPIVCFEGLVVADARQDVTCKLYDGETLLAEVVDSMESYVARQTGDMGIYEALLKFSDSAYAYFHKN